jgi:hypothetical protein
MRNHSTNIINCGLTAWAVVLGGCAGSVPLTRIDRPVHKNAAIRIASDLLIGFGRAQIGANREEARQTARAAALRELAEQINVTISADVNAHTARLEANGANASFDVVRENTVLATCVTIEGWYEIDSGETSDGFLWIKVGLRRSDYENQLRRKKAEQSNEIVRMLDAANNGSARSRIRTLLHCLATIDSSNSSAYADECRARLETLLASIEIRPTIAHLRLNATDALPDTLGAQILCAGRPDGSLALRWFAADARITPVNGLICKPGYATVDLRPLPPTQAPIDVEATLDLGATGFELARRGFRLPCGRFSVQRSHTNLFCPASDTFSRSVARNLTQRSAITFTDTPENAAYTVESEILSIRPIAITNNVYLASAALGVRVFGRDGVMVIDITRDIRSADGRSADAAVRNTQVLALEEATRQIENIF